MTNEQFKPVRISDYYRDRIAKGLRDNIWETMFKPIFDILNSETLVLNSKVENFNPYHDEYGKFCNKNKAVDALIKDIKPVEIKGTLIPVFGKKNHKGIRNHVIEAFRQVGNVTIKSNGRNVVFTKDGAKRTSQKQSPADIKQSAFYIKINEIVERAKYFNFIPADERHRHKVKGQEIYYSRFNIDNEAYMVKMAVDVPLDKYIEQGATYNFAGHRVKQIEIAPARIKVSVDNQHSLAETDAITIITYYNEGFNPTVTNAKQSALITALNSGRIYYENGAFKAVDRFSNAVASEIEALGGKFKYGAYYIDRALLPVEIENALAMIAARESAKLVALNGLLVRLASDVTKAQFNKLLIDEAAQLMFKKLEKDLIDSTSEGKVPTVGTYYEVPDFEIADEKINEINKFYEEGGEGEAPEIDLETDVVGPKGKKKKRKKNKNGGSGSGNGNGNNFDTDDNNGNNPPKDGENGSNGGNDSNDDNGNDGSSSDTDTNTNTNIDYNTSLKVFKEDKWTKKIAKDYVYNMNFWVKKWKAKEIIKMRRDVLEMVQSGARTETIQKYFEKEWKIAKDKAAFLARNESEIASSVLKAVHYQRMGCTHFFWLESTSKEKRELHLEYAKKTGNKYGIGGTNIFAFDNPPIIEELRIKKGNGKYYVIPKPGGQRGLPGQTYNCGCNLLGVKYYQKYVNQGNIENAKGTIFTKIKNTIKNCLQRNNYHWRYRRFGEGQAV